MEVVELKLCEFCYKSYKRKKDKDERLFNKVVLLVHKKAKTFKSDNRISKKTYDQNFDEINDCLKNKNFEICNKKLKTLCSIHSNINDNDIIIEDSENEEL